MFKNKNIEKEVFEIARLLDMTDEEYYDEFIFGTYNPDVKQWIKVCGKLLRLCEYQQVTIEDLEQELTEKQNKTTVNLLKVINDLKKEVNELKRHV